MITWMSENHAAQSKQSVSNFCSGQVDAATGRTTKSVTVTQLDNSHSTTSG